MMRDARTIKLLYTKGNMVQYSNSVQIMAYICGVILLPVYALGPLSMIYLSSNRIADGDWQTLIFLFFLCSALVYFCGKYFFLLVRFLRSLKFSFTFDSKGIVLCKNEQSSFYAWSDLKNSKEYANCQMYCLVDSNGEHLFSIWEYADNYQEFRDAALVHIGI